MTMAITSKAALKMAEKAKKNLAILFGEPPSVKITILSFSFDSLKSVIASETKNAIGTTKSSTRGSINE